MSSLPSQSSQSSQSLQSPQAHLDLPIDILCAVFVHLDDVEDLLRCECVCKSWRTASRYALNLHWRWLFLRTFGPCRPGGLHLDVSAPHATREQLAFLRSTLHARLTTAGNSCTSSPAAIAVSPPSAARRRTRRPHPHQQHRQQAHGTQDGAQDGALAAALPQHTLHSRSSRIQADACRWWAVSPLDRVHFPLSCGFRHLDLFERDGSESSLAPEDMTSTELIDALSPRSLKSLDSSNRLSLAARSSAALASLLLAIAYEPRADSPSSRPGRELAGTAIGTDSDGSDDSNDSNDSSDNDDNNATAAPPPPVGFTFDTYSFPRLPAASQAKSLLNAIRTERARRRELSPRNKGLLLEHNKLNMHQMEIHGADAVASSSSRSNSTRRRHHDLQSHSSGSLPASQLGSGVTPSAGPHAPFSATLASSPTHGPGSSVTPSQVIAELALSETLLNLPVTAPSPPPALPINTPPPLVARTDFPEAVRQQQPHPPAHSDDYAFGSKSLNSIVTPSAGVVNGSGGATATATTTPITTTASSYYKFDPDALLVVDSSAKQTSGKLQVGSRSLSSSQASILSVLGNQNDSCLHGKVPWRQLFENRWITDMWVDALDFDVAKLGEDGWEPSTSSRDDIPIETLILPTGLTTRAPTAGQVKSIIASALSPLPPDAWVDDLISVELLPDWKPHTVLHDLVHRWQTACAAKGLGDPMVPGAHESGGGLASSFPSVLSSGGGLLPSSSPLSSSMSSSVQVSAPASLPFPATLLHELPSSKAGGKGRDAARGSSASIALQSADAYRLDVLMALANCPAYTQQVTLSGVRRWIQRELAAIEGALASMRPYLSELYAVCIRAHSCPHRHVAEHGRADFASRKGEGGTSGGQSGGEKATGGEIGAQAEFPKVGCCYKFFCSLTRDCTLVGFGFLDVFARTRDQFPLTLLLKGDAAH